MELIKIIDEYEIYTTMVQLSSDMFNQSLNDEKIIKSLSKKYCQYSNFYIYKDEKRIVGYCAFYTNTVHNDNCFISMLVIRKEYQNKGIGTMFVNKIVEICKEKNISAIELSVNKKNTKAINFYKKKQFDIVETDDKFYKIRKIVL